jgi:hypothetical protein
MKTALFLICIVVVSSVTAQNQEYNPTATHSSKFTFGWSYSPEIAYRVLYEGVESDTNTQSIIDSRNENELVKFGHSFSLYLGYNFSNKLSLETGLGYSNFGEALQPYDVFAGINQETFVGRVYKSNHIHVTSIPITLRMSSNGSRFKGFFAVGIAPGVLIRKTSKTVYRYANDDITTWYDVDSDDQKLYNKVILGAHISGGVDIKYGTKASLRIAPILRFTAHNLYTKDAIGANYFNAGIEIGTVYKL